MTVNVLIRGQSNALIFADQGAWKLQEQLESALGQPVNILADWGDSTSTIYSGTAFMDWDTDGEQSGLLQYLRELSPDVKAQPTITLWLHNEYDQGDGSLTKAAWLREVRADAELVREELGQGAETTPYVFVPIRYNYGNNWQPIGDGMEELANDASFNASISWDAQDLAMDGDGWAGSSHMGGSDAALLGERLADVLTPIAQGLEGGTYVPPAPVPQPQPQPAPATPTQPETSGDLAWVESFDGADPNNVLGHMSRWWGNPDWWSVPGQVTMTGKAGEYFDSGVMVPPIGKDAGNGYGTWEIDFNSHGDTIGDYILLWSSEDVWPHGEYDILEFDFGGQPYSAIHYPDENGENTYDSNYYLDTTFNDPHGDHTVSMTWAEDTQGRPYVSVSLDGVVQYVQYDNIERDYAHGGPDNRAVSFGQQFGWNLHAQDGDNSLTVYEVRYNPWSGPAAPPKTGTTEQPGTQPPAGEPPVQQPPSANPEPDRTPVNHVTGSGPDTLVLKVAQDYFQEDAVYSVTVDGKAVGTFTASALQGSGQFDTLTIKGNWAKGKHEVEVTHLNDTWVDGEGDSNIYVPTATYNGKAITALGADWWGGAFTFTDAGATTTTPPAPPPVAEMPEATITGTAGKDVFRFREALQDEVIRGGAGADRFVLGEHEDVTFLFTPGEVKGDVIRGFEEGDVLAFHGFGEGASLIARPNDIYIIRAEDGSKEAFRLVGFELGEGDYLFA